jgi:acyl carrier protein
MNTQSVEERIRAYIADNFLFSKNVYPYPDETSFLENGVIDSMNVIELVLYVEETFNIQVNDEDITPANFDSVRNLSNFIREKQPAVV